MTKIFRLTMNLQSGQQACIRALSLTDPSIGAQRGADVEFSSPNPVRRAAVAPALLDGAKPADHLLLAGQTAAGHVDERDGGLRVDEKVAKELHHFSAKEEQRKRRRRRREKQKSKNIFHSLVGKDLGLHHHVREFIDGHEREADEVQRSRQRFAQVLRIGGPAPSAALRISPADLPRKIALLLQIPQTRNHATSALLLSNVLHNSNSSGKGKIIYTI